MKRKIQVDPSHYHKNLYNSKKRFISFWHQIDEIIKLNPKKVLEIGIGNGFVSNYLKERGVDIVTLDFDKRLKPDIVGDVLDIPLDDNSFDLVACFEVLEHIPYEDAQRALKELHRVAKKNVIISVPDAKKYIRILIEIKNIITINKLLPIPRIRPVKHSFDGQHYWEIDKKGYELDKVINDMEKNRFKLLQTYSLFENPYHRFFVLKKIV